MCLCVFQDNKLCLWSVGDDESRSMGEEMEGDPQLQCECQHAGDVMDLQVGLEISHVGQARHFIG